MCFDETTRAVTVDTVKTYDEINIGDKVYSVDTETNEIIVCSIMDKYTYKYSGQMICSFTSHLSQCVTPNHVVLMAQPDLDKIEDVFAIELPFLQFLSDEQHNKHTYSCHKFSSLRFGRVPSMENGDLHKLIFNNLHFNTDVHTDFYNGKVWGLSISGCTNCLTVRNGKYSFLGV